MLDGVDELRESPLMLRTVERSLERTLLCAVPPLDRTGTKTRDTKAVVVLEIEGGCAMTFEEAVIAKLQPLPENERHKLLALIDAWIEQHRTGDIQRAIAVVQSTWATVPLDQKTLPWVAEDKELEYELG